MEVKEYLPNDKVALEADRSKSKRGSKQKSELADDDMLSVNIEGDID